MIKKFFAPVVVLLLLMQASALHAQSSKMTPIELNNVYSDITDSLFAGGSEWGTVLNAAMKSGEYQKLKPIRLKLQDFIERKQKEVKASPIINGSEKLKEAMIRFLDFEMNMAATSFAPFEKLPASTSSTEVNALIEKITIKAKDETSILSEVQKAQEEYALKNAFTIEKAADPK